jgi:hypothetical protein
MLPVKVGGADDPVYKVFKKNTISFAEGFYRGSQFRVTASVFFEG